MPPATHTEAHIQVYGRVQGVFYRAGVKRQANVLGLTGFVQNLPDGRVDIFAQGPKRQLEELVRQCYDISRAAQVERVAVSFHQPKEIHLNFIIK